MLKTEVKELLQYLKNRISEDKIEACFFEKYANDPDFVELDTLVKGIRDNCKKHFEQIFDLLPDPTIITTMEDGKLLTYNKAFLKMVESRGAINVDESTNLHDLYFELDKRDQLIAELKRTGICENMEILVTDVNKEIFVGLVSAQAIKIEGESYVLSVIRDISEIKKMEAEIKRLATTDKLTQVFNRLKLDEYLQIELERSERTKAPFSIILMDIDSLKTINDVYGNPVGDQVLVELAGILKINVRSTDIAGRWGGEEFLVILPDTEVNGAIVLAEKLREIVEKTEFEKVGKLTASFGVTAYRKDLLPATLISRADLARNKAKLEGRNRVEYL
ncbi:sensor domain-containing diguanylate cyclase [Acetobacterium woodii]|uniref:Putative diguanylate cyclase containing PAS/PAC sensor n=1 Tax=Acetobacterium woodii (strain ATCC 29683 / DSM 1030 / JCM 2381 / KCTC 1655 / WB1) TaxID=931626 RepID=H6LJ18_ACEWD|nr:sensor domain-containing diguanylate cyclase [Acetobacterium woodii]AFA47381.1 putative diguanylate cyclase containing PAS/PAC sensor [Acetobacterium woodii DSM 1030]